MHDTNIDTRQRESAHLAAKLTHALDDELYHPVPSTICLILHECGWERGWGGRWRVCMCFVKCHIYQYVGILPRSKTGTHSHSHTAGVCARVVCVRARDA